MSSSKFSRHRRHNGDVRPKSDDWCTVVRWRGKTSPHTHFEADPVKLSAQLRSMVSHIAPDPRKDELNASQKEQCYVVRSPADWLCISAPFCREVRSTGVLSVDLESIRGTSVDSDAARFYGYSYLLLAGGLGSVVIFDLRRYRRELDSAKDFSTLLPRELQKLLADDSILLLGSHIDKESSELTAQNIKVSCHRLDSGELLRALIRHKCATPVNPNSQSDDGRLGMAAQQFVTFGCHKKTLKRGDEAIYNMEGLYRSFPRWRTFHVYDWERPLSLGSQVYLFFDAVTPIALCWLACATAISKEWPDFSFDDAKDVLRRAPRLVRNMPWTDAYAAYAAEFDPASFQDPVSVDNDDQESEACETAKTAGYPSLQQDLVKDVEMPVSSEEQDSLATSRPAMSRSDSPARPSAACATSTPVTETRAAEAADTESAASAAIVKPAADTESAAGFRPIAGASSAAAAAVAAKSTAAAAADSASKKKTTFAFNRKAKERSDKSKELRERLTRYLSNARKEREDKTPAQTRLEKQREELQEQQKDKPEIVLPEPAPTRPFLTAEEDGFTHWFIECPKYEGDIPFEKREPRSEQDDAFLECDTDAKPYFLRPGLPGSFVRFGRTRKLPDLRNNDLEFEPRLHGYCLACGATEHILRTAEEVDCLARRLQMHAIRRGEPKRLCEYPACEKPYSHTIAVCRTMQGFCGGCRVRGHRFGPDCAGRDLDAAWKEWEKFASKGVLTYSRFKVASWGFFRFGGRIRTHKVDYGKLLERSYADARNYLDRQDDLAANHSRDRRQRKRKAAALESSEGRSRSTSRSTSASASRSSSRSAGASTSDASSTSTSATKRQKRREHYRASFLASEARVRQRERERDQPHPEGRLPGRLLDRLGPQEPRA